MKTIGFYVDNFSERGTEVATYDYAHFNETILGNKSVIITWNPKFPSKKTFEKFQKRFDIVACSNLNFLKLDALYIICYGDGQINLKLPYKTIKHCVFDTSYKGIDGETIYCAISQDLNKRWKTDVPVLPHMINMPKISEKLITLPGLVFGRHGGKDSFDIPFVQNVVKKIVNFYPNIYFLFLNTNKFYNHPNIIHLDENIDLEYKQKFINSCDAMLHARYQGETFGLACGEFAQSKPVITFSESIERNHIDMLSENAILYSTPIELFNILTNFSNTFKPNEYQKYTPEYVMGIFDKIISF